MVSTFLKKADVHIKAGNFEAAEREVGFALEEDATNIYALAYRERIHRARIEHANELAEAAERKKKDEVYRQRERELAAQRAARAAQKSGTAFVPEEKSVSFGGGRLDKSSYTSGQNYREVLSRAWIEGIPSEQDREMIEQAGTEMNVTPEEHTFLEAEVKIDSYINAIKVAWRLQKIIPSQPAAFEEFRQRFGVSAEEHIQLEARLLWELQQQQKHETIFYVDDDTGLTEVMDETLRDAGYKTIIANSPEEALQQLRNIVPDLILCDVRFPNSKLNGLSIYEAVRQMPAFVTVPFLFLSAVIDEHIMHAGLGSGADDYITKPFNPDTLLAIIEGKLKRYKELKRHRH